MKADKTYIHPDYMKEFGRFKGCTEDEIIALMVDQRVN
jgi:hypothetical protein